MALENNCAPVLLYVAFSIMHIMIDIFKDMYNTALVKFVVMVVFASVLNILCERGLGIISWMLVFIPFISMTVITTVLLFNLGLSPYQGSAY